MFNFGKVNFKSHLSKAVTENPDVVNIHEFRLVRLTGSTVENLCGSDTYILDFESDVTTGKPTGLAIKKLDEKVVYFLEMKNNANIFSRVVEILKDKTLVAHFAAFDSQFLPVEYQENFLCTLNGFGLMPIQAIDKPKSLSLANAVEYITGVKIDKSLQTSFNENNASVAQTKYMCYDVLCCEVVYKWLLPTMGEDAMLYWWRKFTTASFVIRDLNEGICFDTEKLASYRKINNDAISVLEKEIRDETSECLNVDIDTLDCVTVVKKVKKFNFASPAQVKVLFNMLGCNTESVSSKSMATAMMSPEINPVILKIMQLKKLMTVEKDLKKYMAMLHSAIPKYGIAVSGRLLSSSPNLQNLPRSSEFRQAVKPVRDTDCFVDVDWSQIELVIAAAILGEQNMLHCFEKGLDLHAHSASLMYKKPIDEVTKGERQLGKVCNFGLLYGLSAAGLVSHAATYGVKLSLNEAETIKSKWLAAYPAINDWQKKAKQKFYGYNDNPREHTYEFKVDSEGNIRLEKDGSSDMKKTLHAKTSSGRITYVNTVQGRLGQLLNFPVQGTCADFLITVVCNIPKMARALGSEVKIAMLTYDAITLSVEKSLGERLKQLLLDECITVGYQLLGYPVSASGKVGNTYADVH